MSNKACLHGLFPSLIKKDRIMRINGLIDSFGLRKQEDTIIGTPIRQGISGGQKRRLSVASQLITAPKILFLDEPTSGLDSAASFEVVSFIKTLAKQNNVSRANTHRLTISNRHTVDRYCQHTPAIYTDILTLR